MLLRCRDETKSLTKISPRLGDNVRTNSEAFLGAFTRGGKIDHTEGISISSIFRAGETTQIEPLRFAEGSSMLLWLLSSPLIERSGGFMRRLWESIVAILRDPLTFLHAKLVPGLEKRGLAIMIMQTEENQMRLKRGRNPYAFFRKDLVAEHDKENAVPVQIDVGHRVVRSSQDRCSGGLRKEPISGAHCLRSSRYILICWKLRGIAWAIPGKAGGLATSNRADGRAILPARVTGTSGSSLRAYLMANHSASSSPLILRASS